MILDTKVGSLANRSLITVDENESVLAAAKLMVERGVGSVIVCSKGAPLSIVTERDLLTKVVAGSRNPEKTKVSEIMSPSPITVDQDETLGEAMELMNRKKVRRMLVTDHGRIVGVFTQRDVLALTRTCRHCGKEIKSALEFKEGAEPYIECPPIHETNIYGAGLRPNCEDGKHSAGHRPFRDSADSGWSFFNGQSAAIRCSRHDPGGNGRRLRHPGEKHLQTPPPTSLIIRFRVPAGSPRPPGRSSPVIGRVSGA